MSNSARIYSLILVLVFNFISLESMGFSELKSAYSEKSGVFNKSEEDAYAEMLAEAVGQLPKKMLDGCAYYLNQSKAERAQCLTDLLASSQDPRIIDECSEVFKGIEARGPRLVASGRKINTYLTHDYQELLKTIPPETYVKVWASMAFRQCLKTRTLGDAYAH